MSLAFNWRPRKNPLEPRVAAALGDAAIRLAMKLLSLDDERLAAFHGVSGPGMLLLIGTSESLPWVDGIMYLGSDPAAPSLLLPTSMESSLPAPLLERALQKRHPDLLPPLAVLFSQKMVFSVSAARPTTRSALNHWLEGKH